MSSGFHSRALRRCRHAAAAAALVLPLAPLSAAAANLGGGEPLEVSLGRIVGALLICILVAGFAVLLIRQRGGRAGLPRLFGRMELRGRAIHVVETRRLSPHADICLVRHDEREYLLLLMAGDGRVLREKELGKAADRPGKAA